MLIDHVTIKVIAGKGGRGAVAFNEVKMALGPTGASGAKGGDVYLEAISDIGALRQFQNKKVFNAQNGEDGRSQFRDGHRGDDLTLKVPRGTVIHDLTSDTLRELTHVGQRVLVAKGGNGGKGNFHFRSSRNTTPMQFQKGLPGEDTMLELELKLIADIGLIGLPNIGKSSFLNEVTNAQSRVANYQFTTLEPNLGAYGDLILADIPGLIEGASVGKGLGIKFLRHIERTAILFHFIDAENPDPLGTYKTVRKELGAYNPELLEKPEYIILSRTDTVDSKQIKAIEKKLASLKKEIVPISIYDPDRMTAMRKVLDRITKSLVAPKKEKTSEK